MQWGFRGVENMILHGKEQTVFI